MYYIVMQYILHCDAVDFKIGPIVIHVVKPINYCIAKIPCPLIVNQKLESSRFFGPFQPVQTNP